jgi:hypothetical protein
MAYFTVRNSLNPQKVITCGITYQQVVDKNSYDGEPIWVLTVATDEPHITTSGTIPPHHITITDELDLDLEIENAVSAISRQVDWEPLAVDTRPPFVDWSEPAAYIATIQSDVKVSIVENHPSEGIDIDSIQMFINNEEVTDDLRISGDEFNYVVRWVPPRVVHTQIQY